MPFGRITKTAVYKAMRPKERKVFYPKQKKAITKIVKKQIDRETQSKQYMLGSGYVAVYDGTAGTALIGLTSVTQGAGDNQRVGDEIYIKAIHIRLNLFNNIGVNANYQNLFRVMIFQYKNSDMNPTLGQIFNVANANGGSTYGTFSSRNIDYMNIYNVLYDQTFQTEQGTPNAANYGQSGKTYKYLKISVPMKWVKRKIQYQAATASHTNGIWMLITTDQSTATANPSYAYDCNVTYINP